MNYLYRHAYKVGGNIIIDYIITDIMAIMIWILFDETKIMFSQ